MKSLPRRLGQTVHAGLALMMGLGLSACWSSDRWKEEVLLHDGSKIIVERTQSFGGSRELNQSPPIKEQEITFTLPNSSKSITFKSEFGEDIGRANFNPLALHVLNGTPYIVTEPNLCLSFNKWGRPNPPYVIFKYEGDTWQRIALSALPAVFKDINLVINTKSHAEKITARSPVSAELVKELNRSLRQPELKTILREPLADKYINDMCSEMLYDGNGGWHGPGLFKELPSYEACLQYCKTNGITSKYCPCTTFFKGK